MFVPRDRAWEAGAFLQLLSRGPLLCGALTCRVDYKLASKTEGLVARGLDVGR